MRISKTLTTERFAYECTQLGATEGRGALLRAQKIAAKATQGLDALIDSMTADDLDYFCNLFAKQTKVRLENGNRPVLRDVFDAHFAGEYFELVQWLAFNLGLNFGPFFQAIQGSGEKIKSAALAGTAVDPQNAAEPSASPTA